MALAEGFVRLYILNVYETDTMNNKLKKNIMKETKKKNYESPSIKVYEMMPMQILNAIRFKTIFVLDAQVQLRWYGES